MNDVPRPEDVSVLVPAAGLGERLGLGPKALLPLAGRPVVDWVVDKARQLGAEVIVACAPGMQAPAGARGVAGGATRQDSVLALAAAATRPWSLVWDAARPFASLDLARRVLAAAVPAGAATACLTGEVRWLVLQQDRVAQALPGTQAGQSQTPQAFATALLRALTQRGAREGWQVQSTTELFLLAGHEVRAVPGEKLNLKLTTREDWLLAEALHARLLS
ncbi:IspD/TarI family cytidylyltransferase [Ramlibacter sp. AN1133]|uniref:IspD/TarI family cytidylyltransferase n=1 Tax=Ramlibacter sp. AN1133 TaxID=3133429 RepID=UPI0030BEAE3A